MPITGTEAILGAAIEQAVRNARPDETQNITNAQLVVIFTAMSKEIIDHFVANALVEVQVNGATGTGGTNGPYPITNQPGIGGIT